MKKKLVSSIGLVLNFLICSITCFAQMPPASLATTTYASGKGLFDSDKILEITLSGKTRDVLNDRSDNAPYRPMTLTYKDDDSLEMSIPVEVKTRGHFRKQKGNCFYPPLQVHFIKSDSLKMSVFSAQDKIKLVMPCKGDEYVVREWLVYRLYNLVTPQSFRARLVRVTLNDTKKNKTQSAFYGILLEEEKQLAKRNGDIAITRKIQPELTEPESFLNMAVFQYLVGNTDWSVEYLQNIKLLAKDSNAVPVAVAYDFDHAGIVDAPYAAPAEQLLLSSVRERRYRGYCIKNMQRFDDALALFNRIKKDIYQLYSDCTLLSEKYKKTTLQYFDDFYSVINNPAMLEKEFGYPCDKNGTGNVVIKGLKED